MTEERPTYRTDTIVKLREKFARTFNLPIDQVWIDARQADQVKEGRRLTIHNLKFTLSLPSFRLISSIIIKSIQEFEWSIFHTCSLDYSKHSETVQIEFEVDHELCTQILAKC